MFNLFQILDLGLCQLTKSGLESVKLSGQIFNAVILQLNQIVQEVYLQKHYPTLGFKMISSIENIMYTASIPSYEAY